MKKKILMAILIVGVYFLITGLTDAGVLNTKHDFSAKPWSTGNKLCGPCHTPHPLPGGPGVATTPLWNHALTTATFTLYASGGTMQSTPTAPSGTTKLCLSCHDGTVAIDSYGGSAGNTNWITSVGYATASNIGTDLSGSHPIGITYDYALYAADGGLNYTTSASGITGTIAEDMLFGGVTPATNSKLECASCHDVHDDSRGKFLIKWNTTSQLCLTCHNK